MKKPIFLVAVAAAAAAAVGFWRRKEASELWNSASDTVSSWGKPVAAKVEEVVEAAKNAVTSWGEHVATKAEEVAEATAEATDSATVQQTTLPRRPRTPPSRSV